MKKIVMTFVAVIAISISAQAQLLWKISGNGIQKPSYLVGTHHIAPMGMQDSIAGLKSAINSVDQVWGELDMSEMTSPQGMAELQKHMVAPADSTLEKVLSHAQLDSVVNLLGKYAGMAIPAAQISPLRPAVISSQLAVLQSMKAIQGFNPNAQLDGIIQQLGAQAGKSIHGLETMSQQLGLLYGAPIAQQAADLMKAVRNDNIATAKAKEMAQAYMSGNLDKLNAMITDPETGMTSQEAEKLIYNRNSAWVDFLIGALPTTSMLIAVGAGHLPGEKGVITLLQKAGFNVTPVED
ncbi:MAG: TraB/GumN family protein [Paramuribaculum sp.]|nr:TraB/GumN family protein [Paramuribaculum sp.]